MNSFEEKIEIRKITKFERRITDFVHNVYLTAFQKYGWKGDYQALMEDDLEFFADADIYAAVGSVTNNIYGTIKGIHKRADKLLPVERDFGVRCQSFLETLGLPNGKIVEIARFATDHLTCKKMQLSHKEVTGALMDRFCLDNGKCNIDYWVASIDAEVLEWLIRIGYHFKPIGPSKFYIGSPTIPVFLDCRGLPD